MPLDVVTVAAPVLLLHYIARLGPRADCEDAVADDRQVVSRNIGRCLGASPLVAVSRQPCHCSIIDASDPDDPRLARTHIRDPGVRRHHVPSEGDGAPGPAGPGNPDGGHVQVCRLAAEAILVVGVGIVRAAHRHETRDGDHVRDTTPIETSVDGKLGTDSRPPVAER